MKKKIVFDLDGTLLKIDSSKALVFYLSKGDCFKKLNFFYYLLRDVLGIEKFRGYRDKILKGYSPIVLRREVKKFVDLCFSKGKFNNYLLTKLRRKKEQSVIISIAVPTVVDVVAKKLGVKHISLGFTKGNMNKYSVYKQRYGDTSFDIYTDNFEDIDLVKKAESGEIVVHNLGQKKEWEKRCNKVGKKIKFYRPPKIYNLVNKRNYKITYIPGFYYFVSRSRDLFWTNSFLKEVIPVFFLTNDYTLGSFIEIILSYFFMVIVYEFGIIMNDYRAIHREKNPTVRIQRGVTYDLFLFFSFRIIALLIFIFLPIFNNGNTKFTFFVLATILSVIFYLHNHLNKNQRKMTYIMLRIFKSLLFISLVLKVDQWMAGLIMIIGLEHLKSFIKYVRGGYNFSFSQSLVLTTILTLFLFLVFPLFSLRIYLLILLIIFYGLTVKRFLDRFVIFA